MIRAPFWPGDNFLAELERLKCKVEEVGARIVADDPAGPSICASPFRWPPLGSLPRREWLFGNWLLKGELATIIAPGGTGKSTIGMTIALSLTSGRPLLGQALHRGPQSVWIFNLEDGPDELDRQLAAASAYHGVRSADCGHRLFVDSGLVQPLCTATEDREGFELNEKVFAQLTQTIRFNRIGVVIVDPFVSSHSANESSNEAIDAIAKRWKRLAHETSCAVVLVHHTRKLGGRDVTAEDSRGAVALRDAARIALTLNIMSKTEAEGFGIADLKLRRSLVRIDMGKSNRAPADGATWIKLESQNLENGTDTEPPDIVGVAALWEQPDVFDGLTVWHLYQVQQLLKDGEWRQNVQANDWVGNLVAEVTGLSVSQDKGRIKSIIGAWLHSGALKVERRADAKGNERPFIVVGNPVDPSEMGNPPHPEKWGGESEEGGEDDSL